MQGISEVLTANGYILNIVITDGDYDKERMILENMLQNPPAGLLFEPVCSGLLSVNDSPAGSIFQDSGTYDSYGFRAAFPVYSTK